LLPQGNLEVLKRPNKEANPTAVAAGDEHFADANFAAAASAEINTGG
jgi:hypothetical protein